MNNSADHIKVALFCGGRGSATLIRELLHWPNIHLTLIVNAYDDGLSTGALREFVTHMLGPSDFRKNLSYLLDPFSKGQYALKNLLEFRLPTTIHSEDIDHLADFVKTEKWTERIEPLHSLFSQLGQNLLTSIRQYMHAFFTYAKTTNLQFDYRDCSIGNIIFAGAYLEKNNNFNAAAQAMSQLVSSRALLLNVSEGENRILVALKENGEFLSNEAQIVSPQSSAAIRDFYLLPQSISSEELDGKNIAEKEAWLKNREALPTISPEVNQALMDANIILFGPGTQHSSLLPSYRIAHAALRNASAPIKAFIMNLEPDHDIQAFSTKDVLDRALSCMGDENNLSHVVTHILIDEECALNNEFLQRQMTYKEAQIIHGAFANHFKKKVHNGQAVIKTIFKKWEQSVNHHSDSAVDIFIDIEKRSLSIHTLYEEFLETNWKKHSLGIELIVNRLRDDTIQESHGYPITYENREGNFPEIAHFSDWLHHKKSEYLVLLTGDGEYRFRDVMLGIKLLEESHFGAVFGSRTQSRLQLKTSLQAAYGEKKMVRKISGMAAFLISIVFSLRYGVIFSDPLTGFRIFKRSRITHRVKNIPVHQKATPITIAKHLIAHHVEIAELPVNYRTFSGFTDPKWRIRRGIKNLLSVFARHSS